MYAASLVQLLGRHVNAIVRLAELHPGFVYPARTLSRAALEHSGRILWLLEPDEIPMRELRFIAAKAEESRLYKDSYPEFDEPDWQEIADTSLGAGAVPRIPGFRDLMKLLPLPAQISEMGYRAYRRPPTGQSLGP